MASLTLYTVNQKKQKDRQPKFIEQFSIHLAPLKNLPGLVCDWELQLFVAQSLNNASG